MTPEMQAAPSAFACSLPAENPMLLFRVATPRIITGSIDTVMSWQFLDRFVFHNNVTDFIESAKDTRRQFATSFYGGES